MHKIALLVSLTMLKFQGMMTKMQMTHVAYLKSRHSTTVVEFSKSERPQRKTGGRAPSGSFARLSLSRSGSS